MNTGHPRYLLSFTITEEDIMLHFSGGDDVRLMLSDFLGMMSMLEKPANWIAAEMKTEQDQ